MTSAPSFPFLYIYIKLEANNRVTASWATQTDRKTEERRVQRGRAHPSVLTSFCGTEGVQPQKHNYISATSCLSENGAGGLVIVPERFSVNCIRGKYLTQGEMLISLEKLWLFSFSLNLVGDETVKQPEIEICCTFTFGDISEDVSKLKRRPLLLCVDQHLALHR